MSRDVVLGLDLGPVTTHSALVVIECDRERNQFGCAVRYVHQFPVGTPYVEIATTVGQVVHEGSLGHVPLVIDITAIGPGIEQLFRQAVKSAWLNLVMLTAGGIAVKDDETKIWKIPKRDLVTTMQLLLQGERFKVANGLANAELLVHELKTFRTNLPISTSPDTLDWRDQPHDDLVLATALACWWGQRHRPSDPSMISSGGNEELHELLRKVFPEQYPPLKYGDW